MSDTIVKHENAFMPMLSIEEATARYNAIVEFTKRVMKQDKDYGIIPGTNKPTLLKPGAEKLCSLFGLTPEFNVIDEITNFDKCLFYYRYKCRLSRGGSLVAEGEGSSNSMEKKYRYRSVPEKKATEEEKATALRKEIKSGKYGDYTVYVIENKEPFELINTLQKMAQKRALIAATLIAANASEFFIQDTEDLTIIEGDFTDIEQPKSEPKPKSPKSQPAQPAGDRPYPPEIVKAGLTQKLKDKAQFNPSEKQMNFLRYGLELLFDGDEAMDDKRHTVLHFLTGNESTKQVDGKWFKVLAEDWLKMEKKDDGSGEYSVDKLAVQEAHAIYEYCLKAEGQQEMKI